MLKIITENFPPQVYISLMAQYFPAGMAKEHPELNRKISQEEYDQIEQYVEELEIQNRIYARFR